ncbi:hypothetical protein CEQ90_19415 [Lewinellaceae bacterium SD302]|nr:hypothetical protein CEQ90_19415 [Lewinellaceae bacterium SD302]
MNTNVTYIFLFVLAVAGGLSAQSGCPGCTLDLPVELPADTIFIGPTPNATFNEYYEADLSFRLPMTTTPVANTGGNVPPGLNIGSIEIVNVLNVPPGLSWEANETFFEVIDGETDGCVRFCGVPLQVDSFSIEVVLEASLFITTETSVFVPLVVEPATSSNDGFSLINNEGCGSVTTEFINNVPSNDSAGYTYSWDFGNGFTSSAENPGTVTYDEPGVYPVSYEATVDTAGYFLTDVMVTASPCSDILSNPDLKVNIFDPNGDLVITTPIIDNTDPPVSWSLFIPIGEGEYRLQVVDDDGGIDGADDDCGSFTFTQTEDGTFIDGELVVTTTIFHPVTTVTGNDTVYVYEQPEAPEFGPILTIAFCPEDLIDLSVVNYDSNLTWFLDSVNLNLPDTQTLYVADASANGEYLVRYTSADGCISEAIAPGWDVIPLPDTVSLFNSLNLVEADSSDQPLDVEFYWELNGDSISQQYFRFCATETGLYTLVLIDPVTRCEVRSSIFVNYDPDKPCDIVSVKETIAAGGWSVYPNPGSGPLYLNGELARTTELSIRLVDATGRELLRRETIATAGPWNYGLRQLSLPAGLYYLVLTDSKETVTLPLVRR